MGEYAVTDVKEAIRAYMEQKNRYWVTGDWQTLANLVAGNEDSTEWRRLRLGWERKRHAADIRHTKLLRAHSRVRILRLQPSAGETDAVGPSGECVEVVMDETITWVYRDGFDYGVEARVVRHWQRWRRQDDGWRVEQAIESDEVRQQSEDTSATQEPPAQGMQDLFRRFARPRCNEYDRVKALRYAELWWNRPNPAFVYFKVDDCTNFISQCLYSANVPMHDTGNRSSGWWYRFNGNRPDQWSYSWATSHGLYLHLRNQVQATVMTSARELKIGDVIFYDWEGDGRFTHSTIVVDFDQQGDPLVNAHTDSSYHRHYLYTDSRAWTEKTRYVFLHLPKRVC
jgi:hypothetical protein